MESNRYQYGHVQSLKTVAENWICKYECRREWVRILIFSKKVSPFILSQRGTKL